MPMVEIIEDFNPITPEKTHQDDTCTYGREGDSDSNDDKNASDDIEQDNNDYSDSSSKNDKDTGKYKKYMAEAGDIKNYDNRELAILRRRYAQE